MYFLFIITLSFNYFICNHHWHYFVLYQLYPPSFQKVFLFCNFFLSTFFIFFSPSSTAFYFFLLESLLIPFLFFLPFPYVSFYHLQEPFQLLVASKYLFLASASDKDLFFRAETAILHHYSIQLSF